MDISTLRNMRKAAGTDFSKIAGAIDKIANPETRSYVDDRFWKLEADKAGNASATIRFLPVIDGVDELPWVRVFSHGFQGPTGKWYIENSRTTIGEDDPVSMYNSELWNSGNEADKEIARKQKRRLQFIANILVVNDPKNPDNNGKIFLYKFGKKIFDKIMDKARPTFEDEDPVNVFDPWSGADFRLRMKRVAGFPNYDDSVFADPSEISDDDEELLKILNSRVPLKEFIDPAQFKSFEELKKRLDFVLNVAGPSTSAEELVAKQADVGKSVEASEPKSKASVMDDDDEEDTAAFFTRIAQEG